MTFDRGSGLNILETLKIVKEKQTSLEGTPSPRTLATRPADRLTAVFFTR